MTSSSILLLDGEGAPTSLIKAGTTPLSVGYQKKSFSCSGIEVEIPEVANRHHTKTNCDFDIVTFAFVENKETWEQSRESDEATLAATIDKHLIYFS